MFTQLVSRFMVRLVSKTSLSVFTLALSAAIMMPGAASAQPITEDFASIATLPASGWSTQNNSVPVGTTGWFQGNATTFPSQAGAPTAYIAANFNNTTGTNTISNWLVAPNRTMNNGDVYRFWTRTATGGTFPDRLQVRLSTNGASTNVGTGPTGVGDFTTVLLDINPTYGTGTAYPNVWTEFAITISGLAGPTSGRIAFRYFVENGGPTGDNSNYIGIDTFSYTPASAPVNTQNIVDFNGDGRTDYAVVRNTGGGAGGQLTWFWNEAGTATTLASEWGLSTDFIVPEDYDGDNKTDIAVWRPGAAGEATFYILQSDGNVLRQELFGQSGDDPTVVGDYDGDGKADLAVYRSGLMAGDQSTWFYRGSLNNPGGNVTYVPWGQNGDFPAPGDYDGDGRHDFVIQRNDGGGNARFWLNQTTDGFATILFGTPTDVIVPGDYDGDGKTDLAVVRGISGQINWFIRNSSNGAISQNVWGNSATDFVTQGDYDGDGRTDFAVWRGSSSPGESAFYVFGTTSGVIINPFGQSGDFPAANYNTH